MIVARAIPRRNGWSGGQDFSWPAFWRTLLRSMLALFAPLIIVGGIRFGIFTPTGAAGIGVAYALFVGAVIYRSLSLRSVAGMLRKTTETTGAILLVIGMASVFGWILATEQVPQLAVIGIDATTDNWVVALLMMAVVLVQGTFAEAIAIILILAPVFMPVLDAYGFDPVHFGILLTINLAIGANTPPLGIELMAVYRTGTISMSDSFRYLMPFLGVMIAALGLIVVFPALVIL